jgi:hypothetical protein
MKKVSYVSIASTLLMLALFPVQVGITNVAARVGKLIAAEVSVSPGSPPQNKEFE